MPSRASFPCPAAASLELSTPDFGGRSLEDLGFESLHLTLEKRYEKVYDKVARDEQVLDALNDPDKRIALQRRIDSSQKKLNEFFIGFLLSSLIH